MKMSWEVRDLWANRMCDATVAVIIGNSTATGNATTGYNAQPLVRGDIMLRKRVMLKGWPRIILYCLEM